MNNPQKIEDWEKTFDEWFFTIVHAENADWTKSQTNRIRWQVKGKIRSLLSERDAEIIKIAEGIKEEALTFEPPKKCGREEKGISCTSCPEMRGRANGYRRAINDFIAELRKNK